MAIVLLYSFHIVSAGRDRMSARRNLPFQFDESRNLLFSIVFGFKTIIFDKFIVYYRFFIVFYRISIKFLSFTISIEFYQILSFQDDTIRQRNFIALEPDFVIEIYNPVSCRQTLDQKQALSPTLTPITVNFLFYLGLHINQTKNSGTPRFVKRALEFHRNLVEKHCLR